ncbi:MAG: 5-(carboxyamino)imidazole ribonucleotide mutase [Deltaproteobacteria bacterium]|nr:5-(carboxyamino)imidazole ribonucleotide mutase [Deltaproteobacteria bacterium]
MPTRRRGTRTRAPLVGIIMGSASDGPTMSAAVDLLGALGVPCEARVVSAHRMPDEMFTYAETAEARGLRVIIAGAGGAAHLPGMVASKTRLPVLGVPVQSKALHGLDSLLSIVQMPGGVPVATFAIGEAGAKNAALFAAAVLALHDDTLARRLTAFRAKQTAEARASTPGKAKG